MKNKHIYLCRINRVIQLEVIRIGPILDSTHCIGFKTLWISAFTNRMYVQCQLYAVQILTGNFKKDCCVNFQLLINGI